MITSGVLCSEKEDFFGLLISTKCRHVREVLTNKESIASWRRLYSSSGSLSPRIIICIRHNKKCQDDSLFFFWWSISNSILLWNSLNRWEYECEINDRMMRKH